MSADLDDADAAADAFWAFSLAVYAKPGVKEACLAFQEQGGDVNTGLFAAWVARLGRDPSAVISKAGALGRDWSGAVVKPLRAARDALKPAPDYVDAQAGAALRKQILSAELEAERLQQRALAPLEVSCPVSTEPPGALAAAALERWAGEAGLGYDARAFVEIVFSAAET